jgi:hypothetical protein
MEIEMKDGLFTQNPEYHEGTYIEEDDDLVHFLVELSDRLADESDYDDYLAPKLLSAIKFLVGD